MSRGRQQLREIDLWLQRVYKEHPLLVDLLIVGIALLFFGVAMLPEWIP